LRISIVGDLHSPFNRCHIGQPERFALSHNGCIADLLQFIKRAVEADKNLRAPGLNEPAAVNAF
jgi:hypothetical protein